ncbi:hypothetical protein TCSYLVIO_005974 [Trypanosoma cruzi]|nr:hypothetical protein TCSYLVIO_005974 [Trypanosoma cruzi]
MCQQSIFVGQKVRKNATLHKFRGLQKRFQRGPHVFQRRQWRERRKDAMCLLIALNVKRGPHVARYTGAGKDTAAKHAAMTINIWGKKLPHVGEVQVSQKKKKKKKQTSTSIKPSPRLLQRVQPQHTIGDDGLAQCTQHARTPQKGIHSTLMHTHKKRQSFVLRSRRTPHRVEGSRGGVVGIFGDSNQVIIIIKKHGYTKRTRYTPLDSIR